MAYGPDNTSFDYRQMLPYWEKVSAILGGVDAVRAAGRSFLPQFPKETDESYKLRLSTARFTNIFEDVIESLASKPFSEEVTITKSPTVIKALAENVDACGNNLSVFASETFFRGIAYGLDWIFVDYPEVPEGLSLGAERSLGIRPYWVHISAKDVIWVESEIIDGQEQFTYFVRREMMTRREGYEQKAVERIWVYSRDLISEEGALPRIFAPARFEAFERDAKSSGGWKMVHSGELSIDVIPAVPFMTGRREGSTWQFKPPMRSVVEAQLEHYEQETDLKSARRQTAFPMLTANGIDQPMDTLTGEPVTIQVGPNVVLFTGKAEGGEQNGEFKYIEPDAQTLRFLSDEVSNTEKQIRELGRQPLTAASGNITVITAAFAGDKANSAIQAWAFALKDAIEWAFYYTELWMGMKSDNGQTEVSVFTEFALSDDNGDAMDKVLELRKTGDISREAVIAEAKRYKILNADYDVVADLALLDAEPDDESDALLAGLARGINANQKAQDAPDNSGTE